jgi:hypothetical protein
MALDADGANASGGDYFLIKKRGNSGTTDFEQYSNASMRFGTNFINRATYDMTLGPTGNVTIGTTTAGESGSAKFTVTGNSVVFNPNTDGKDTFKFTTGAADKGALYIKDDTVVKVKLDTNGDSYLNGGNVGIGTTTPQAKLHIDAGSGAISLRDYKSIVYNLDASIPEGATYQRFSIDINTGVTTFARTAAYVKVTVVPSPDGGIGIVNSSTAEFSISRVDGNNNAAFKIMSVDNGSIGIATPVASGNSILFGFTMAFNGTGTTPTFTIKIEVIARDVGNYVITPITGVVEHTGATLQNRKIITSDATAVLIGSTTSEGQTLKIGSAAGGDSILGISAGAASTSSLWFGDTDANVGYILYNHVSNYMAFRANGGSESMRITSAGNLLVGVTDGGGTTGRAVFASSQSYTNSGDNAGQVHLINTNNTVNNRSSLQFYNSLVGVVAGIDSVNRSHIAQTGDLQFWTVENGNLRDTMRMTNGNVGIGTTNPSTKLDVAGTIGISVTNTPAIIRRTVVSGSNGIRIQGNTSDTINTDAAAGAYIAVGGGVIGDTFEGNIDIVAYGGNVDANRNQIKFSNRSGVDTIQERMRINKDGNVGIGTSDPLAKLSIIDEDGGQAMLQIRNYSTAATGAFSNAYTAEIRGASSGTQMHGMLIHLNETGYTTDRRTLDVSDYNGVFASFTNGRVGIGTVSPSTKLEVVKQGNSSGGTMMLSGSKTNSSVKYGYMTGAHYTSDTYTQGIGIIGCTSLSDTNTISIGGDVGEVIAATTIKFWTAANTTTGGGTERARFTTTGYFKASNVGTYNDATGNYHEFRGDTANSYVVVTTCTNATPLSEYIQDFRFSAATPNDGNARFWSCTDATAERAYIRSNGGLSNYSANNTNLSDRREKTNFAPATAYLDKICAIPVQTFNYIDQNFETDDGLTLGVVAQDVQAVAPELVTESNWGSKEDPKMRLSIYQTDLQYALMKCIQEQQAIIESLKARLDAAGL